MTVYWDHKLSPIDGAVENERVMDIANAAERINSRSMYVGPSYGRVPSVKLRTGANWFFVLVY